MAKKNHGELDLSLTGSQVLSARSNRPSARRPSSSGGRMSDSVSSYNLTVHFIHSYGIGFHITCIHWLMDVRLLYSYTYRSRFCFVWMKSDPT